MTQDQVTARSPDSRFDALGLEFDGCRRKLVRFFSARGRAFAADELADDTIMRMMAKIESGVVIASITAYALTVGRLVLLESLRKPAPEELDEDRLDVKATTDDGDAAAMECLERVLSALPQPARDTILRFYGHGADGQKAKDGRRQLARDLGVTRQALDNRASRSRRAIEAQVMACLEHSGAATGSGPFSHNR